MPKNIYQIQIELKGIKPKIWRRILVDPDIFLDDFHRILQTTMGWTNSHLHMFTAGRENYAPEDFEVEDTHDSYKVKLFEILKNEKSKIKYEYDFGDGWEHNIILEKILPVDIEAQIPKCIAGSRNCPPEDCGGTWGYANMLKILKQPEHDEFEEYLEWLGGEFDPEYFDIEEINELLQEDDYGCLWL